MSNLLLLLLFFVSVVPALTAQVPLSRVAESFVVGQVSVDGHGYPYRLLEPLPDLASGKRPLVVFLHGAGERGDDNIGQLKWMPELMARAERRRQLPCYLLALQCPVTEQWVDGPWGDPVPRRVAAQPTRALRAVMAAMDEVLKRPDVDRGRVYVTGLSMGGFGTWDLIARCPEKFAAAAPICGGGDPEVAGRWMGLPVEVWHGEADPVVPVALSHRMAEQYERLGLKLRYFERAGVGHDVWRQAYADGCSVDWLFQHDQRQQYRGAWADVAIIPLPDKVEVRAGTFQLRAQTRCHAPEELRRLANFYLDTLDVDPAWRPVVVSDGATAEGDLVLRIDPNQSALYLLEIDAVVRLSAPDVNGMRIGLAALHQAVRTRVGGGAPYGRFCCEKMERGSWLVLEPPDGRWQREQLLALLRECWLGAVQTICIQGDSSLHAAERELQELEATAELLGISVGGVWPSDSSVRFRMSGSGDSIAKAMSKVGDAKQAAVVLASATPQNMLREARRLLPAALECSQRGVKSKGRASFLSRLAVRWR